MDSVEEYDAADCGIDCFSYYCCWFISYCWFISCCWFIAAAGKAFPFAFVYWGFCLNEIIDLKQCIGSRGGNANSENV